MPLVLESILEKYRAAAEADPDSVEAQANLAWGYYGQKQFAEAAEQFEKALRLEANAVDAHWGLGLALKNLGRKEAALAAFEKAAALAPQIADITRSHMLVRLAHGQINQLRQGAWNLAKETWQKA